MSRICAVGANVFDTLISVPHFPEEDTKLRGGEITQCGGGPCATGLVAAAKLGAECVFIGNLADDFGGVFLKADMEKYNISTKYIDMLPGFSSFCSYIMINEENASRTCVFNKGNVPETFLNDEKKAEIAASDILMVDGNDLEAAVCAAKHAGKFGTKVLYDAGGLYDGIERLLPLADILIPSEEFALSHTGAKTAAEAARKLKEMYDPEVVVITCGKDGGLLFDGGEIIEYPAFKVEAVDTNGAGDVFHGAFAYAAAAGFDYYKCCVFSSAVSAIKCTGTGARRSAPGYETVKNFLKERGYDEF
ncbi:MAG: bifunctional hydroxymethylpyrimidine kinase/phosphomethylpyrimidine kinase [Clostridia bacterium]|nr:bifunctional hydroxymethylpyrimidine kinase/phosphomethylpyrimidine kinase [Clostridia bacterium]